MPTQDNEKELKKQPEIEIDEHKSEALLPIFTAFYDAHIDTFNDLQRQKAENIDRITKNEGKISDLSEKADRLTATNEMFKALADKGKLPKAVTSAIIKSNESKIKSIRENQIPKAEKIIDKAKNKITRLDERSVVAKLKADRLQGFSNLIKSFTVLNPQKRREMFKEAMESLNDTTKGLLKIDLNREKAKLERFSERYRNANSMTRKFDLGQKIDAVRANITSIEAKINRLENAPKLNQVNDHTLDKTIAKTEKSVDDADISNNLFNLDKPINTVVLDTAEYLHNIEVALEDDFNMIDGIINNDMKERPDVPLFLKEIDFGSCDDATLQAFRDSAKANRECTKEISQALAKNYDFESYTLNSEQALADVREKFSDDRIAFVLASALNGTADGRISKEVKDFARDTLKNVPEQHTKNKPILNSHAGLINLFAKAVIKSQAEKQIEQPTKQEHSNPEPKKAEPTEEKKVGLLSFEQFGEVRFRVVDETANDILKLANASEKPFMALMDIGKPVSEIQFAELEQSTQAKFSVDINFDNNTVRLMGINGGKGGIAEGDRNEQNTYFRTAKLTDFAKEQPKKVATKAKTINPDYYKSLSQEDRVVSHETEKVGTIIMNELEKQKIPFSAVQTDKGITITVSKDNEQAFRNTETQAKDTHVKLIHPEIYAQIPKENRAFTHLSADEGKKAVEQLEQSGVKFSAKIEGDKSVITTSKADKPKVKGYFTRADMKRQAQELKSQNPEKNKTKSKGQEL